ncbi:ABC transporter ATP-binding protein [Psychroflexus maritimus]|uniref:ABC transporter ATP-binding protein n=1 Tax=Psychroflexus maritimus TaxID=2714865 RepID=A0A967E2P6_9FLAO|nr:ABC transporter ATP-binding protein [Psychroflexus maritimus]NGZ89959.1 ABC transporter ATP-binding protein [Psychroflexus maritimus]
MDRILEVNNLTKSFNQGKSFALKNLNFHIDRGHICAVVGESGSGKTTLIRLIAGLENPDQGEIILNNYLVSSLKKVVAPEKRNIGMVFQEYALFPHLNVMDNIIYGLTKSKNKKERAQEVIDLVGLTNFEKRYPHELSGGQQQRVALARALAPKPSLLILDEPFSNLDAMMRHQLRNEVFNIIKKTGVTAIFVTHDTQDALAVADEILILQNGQLVQKDEASKLYNQPQSIYVASLFGNTVQLNKGLKKAFRCPLKEDCCHAIRNENITINASDCEYVTEASILKRTFLGTHSQLLLKLENGENLTVVTNEAVLGDTLKIGFNSKDVLQFDE